MPVRPSRQPGAIGREELRRRREEKLAEALASAERALQQKKGDEAFLEAQEALDQATLLSPDDARVLALWKRLDAERPKRVKALLDQARSELEARSLEAAAASVDRAVDLQPDSRPAQELRNEVHARLNAGSRRAQAGWRIAAGLVIGIGSLGAATLALIPDVGPAAGDDALVARTDDAGPSAGYEPLAADDEAEGEEALTGEGLDADGAADAEGEAQAGSGRIAGASISDFGGAPPAVAAPAAPATPAPIRPASPPRASAPPAAAAAAARGGGGDAGPIVVVRMCDEGVGCGALSLRVQPAADILFNGVQVGTGAQGMLRLPAGRHQIRLQSDEHEFRRMVTIARGAPATLEVDLPDEGLPRNPPPG